MSKQEGFPGVYVEALSLGLPLSLRMSGGLRNYPKKDRFGQIVRAIKEAAQAITNYMTSASNFDVNEG